MPFLPCGGWWKRCAELRSSTHIPTLQKENTIHKKNNATGDFGKDNYWKWCTRLDNGISKQQFMQKLGARKSVL